MIKRFITGIVFILGITSMAYADITTGKFGTAQLFDVQWNISGGTLNTSSYSYLYRSVPSSSRMNSSDYAAIDAAGQYFAFFDSTTNPGTYGMALYNSDGTQAEVIHNTGTFRTLADGAIFYLGNGSWGTLITTAEGFAIGSSSSFTVEEDRPSNTYMSTWVPDSTEPLAVGETASSGPTVVGTAPGTPIVTTSSSAGASTTSTSTSYAISENDTHQTFTTTVTTTTSTPTTTTTCTTPTTVTTYSDDTTTTANGTQTCASNTTTVTTSSDAVSEVRGRIDQMSTLTDINRFVGRDLNFDGVNAVGQKHDYENGMTGETVGFSAGHKIVNDNNVIFGLGGARLSTDIDDKTNTASADSTVANITLGKRLEKADVEVNVTHMNTDYSYTREIGSNTHGATASGKDTTVTATVTRRDEVFQPVVGIARGKRTVEGYTETGSSATARTVNKDSEYYTYGIVGGRADLGMPYIEVTRYTDGVNTWGVGLSEETENRTWQVGVQRTETKFGTSDRIQLTFEFRW